MADDDPRGWRLGGGVTYAALTTARLGLRTAALVGADELAAGATELDLLRAAGVSLRLVPLAHGPVYENVETPAGRVQICLAPGDPLPARALPASWAGAPAWMIVPIAGETGPDWAAAVPPEVRLAVGWQGLLRRLSPDTRVVKLLPTASPLVRRADLIGVSRHDVDPGTRLGDLSRLLHPGTRLVVTRGALGGLLVTAGGPGSGAIRAYPAIAATEVEPTGAGDVFLAAFVAAGLAGPSGDEQAIGWATAAAGLAVEGPGLGAVPDRAAMLARLGRRSPGPLLEPTEMDLIDS